MLGMEYALPLIASCFLASLIQSISGLGSTIVLMGLLPLFLPYKTANITALVCAIVMLVLTSWSLRKSLQLKLVLLPVALSLVGRILSLQLLDRLSDGVLMKLSGTFLILVAIYLTFLSDKIHLKPTNGNGMLVGFLAGIMGGLTNISGPVFATYYLPASKRNEEYSANLQFSFMVGCIFTLSMHFVKGNITGTLLKYGLIGSIGTIVGVYGGIKIFQKINRTNLRRIICSVIAIMGILQLT